MSKIQVNEIVNHFDNGAPDCPKGFTVSSGISTFTGAIDANGSLDVDGHTNLDNVNISGVVTATSFVGNVTGNVIGNVTGNVTGNADSATTATTATNAQGLTGSPSISVASLNASGNVTIGGTLTYDDVTNIDSVGIITTKAGIDIVGDSKKLNFDSGASGVFEIYRESSGNAYIRATNQLRIQSGNRISFYNFSSGTDYLTLDTSGNTVTGNTNIIGNVGIGTDNPGKQLHISSSTPAIRLTDTDTSGPITNDIESVSGDLFLDTGSVHRDVIISSVGRTNEIVRFTGGGNVGISSAVPKTDLDVSAKTGAVALPQGTTAQRPSGSAPYIRKNTTNNALEYFDGTSWVEIITDYFPTGSTILG